MSIAVKQRPPGSRMYDRGFPMSFHLRANGGHLAIRTGGVSTLLPRLFSLGRRSTGRPKRDLQTLTSATDSPLASSARRDLDARKKLTCSGCGRSRAATRATVWGSPHRRCPERAGPCRTMSDGPEGIPPGLFVFPAAPGRWRPVAGFGQDRRWMRAFSGINAATTGLARSCSTTELFPLALRYCSTGCELNGIEQRG